MHKTGTMKHMHINKSLDFLISQSKAYNLKKTSKMVNVFENVN